MKFRKKPVVIEAMQWDGTEQGCQTLKAAFPELETLGKCRNTHQPEVMHWRIGTLEGGHVVSPGDWIIKGVKGEHYPCKPDIFALTYEAAALALPDAEPVSTKEPLPHAQLVGLAAALRGWSMRSFSREIDTAIHAKPKGES